MITRKHLSCGSAADGRMATRVSLRGWPASSCNRSVAGARSSKTNTLARWVARRSRALVHRGHSEGVRF